MPVIVGATAPVSWASGGTVAASLAVRLPDTTTLTPAPTVTVSAGTQSATIVTSQPGRHLLTWTLAGVTFVDILDVWPADPRYIISIADALGILGSMPASQQNDLALYVATATYVIENLAGPVISAARTYLTDGPRTSVVLPAAPVQVSQVMVGAVVLDPALYQVDADAGLVFSSFPTGPPRNISVTYTVGSTTIPANLRLAAAELIKHLWSSGRRTGTPGRMDAPADMVATPFGFAVPKRVVELCNLTVHAGGFA